ncbi:MAG: hypothetical protein K0R62_6251 [Nonomuraea muscovyensis]|jgi:hypothetical protein|nr:hypothetical protein [Nonomuraea muscovyensis]
MAAALVSHFHCPACGPLALGKTRAICGQIIPPPVVGNGPTRKCPTSNPRAHAFASFRFIDTDQR